MTAALAPEALDQLFRSARSNHQFSDQPLSQELIKQLYEILKWGPTAFNGQPARYVFVQSRGAKEKLAPALAPGNRDKTVAAPLTVIVAYDSAFHQQLPSQFPAFDAKKFYDGKPQLITPHALSNATLQAGYLILAARSLGLDAGPMAGLDSQAVNQAFFPDGKYQTVMLINLGYGKRDGLPARGPRLAFDAVAEIV